MPARRLRILFVGHRFPPDGSGGYELHCEAVRRHLAERGHDVRVLVPRRERGVEDPGVLQQLRWAPPGTALGLRAAARFERHNRRALRAQLDGFRPHVVGWWRLGETSVGLVREVHRRGVPAVGVVGDGWLWEGPERDPWRAAAAGLPRPLRRVAAPPVPWADAATWVFVSEWLRAEAERRGLGRLRGTVQSAGVDLGTFTPGPARRPWRGELLYAGRLSPLKGVDTAVDAVAGLPAARLALVGDGAPDVVAALRRRVADRGVGDRVELRPAADRAAVAAAYRRADAVLFPVRWEEPFGLVPLEAMASGTPVVATGTGGSAEHLAHERNCLLVPRDDPPALAAAVRRLAGDEALRERLVAGGLATAQGHASATSDRVLAALLESAARPVPGDGLGSAVGRC